MRISDWSSDVCSSDLAALVIALRFARLERDVPVVQRAGDAVAVDDALAQRAFLVRAFVDQREDMVVAGAEDGDFLLSGNPHRAGAALGNVGQRSDVDPVGHVVHSAAMAPKGIGGSRCWCSSL